MARDLRLERLYARAAFGARPGDSTDPAEVDGAGWIAEQLAPRDDPKLARRLARFPSLALEPGALVDMLPAPGREGGRRAALDADAKRELKERTGEVVGEVVGARVVRAVHGERQLREVMIDFWSNHFSVFARKGPIAVVLPHYQQSVIEPHALGRFGDLLTATAKSPAMLFYLDNWTSVAPQGRRGRTRGRGGPRRANGINENYARELLELHTLGVDGGYTQQDVREVARVFTGWTLESRRRPVFAFREVLHDPGRKVVLGEVTRGDGQEEGERLLARLARHPSTARFVSTKLVRRFVADEPPPALVALAARRFLDTDGSIADVLRVILESPEFVSPSHRKLKTPFRFAVSAVRATGGETDGSRPFLRALGRLGEVPYFARTPAGYPESAEHWVDPAAMLERMGVAFALASGRLRGTRLGSGWYPGGLERSHGDGAPLQRTERLAVAIASPEFQWT